LTSSTRARLPLAKQKYNFMAIYHLSVKAVSRSAGRSATAAAAYRAGCEITDHRTGEIHDYTRKGGVESADIVLPDGAPEWATDRAALWNAAEAAERRKDACVAREFEVALPDELSPAERRRLAVDFAKEMANREGCAVDVAIHAPGKEGDSRNHHAHILRTTRKVGLDGLTDKLDTEKAGRNRTADLDAVRTRWAELTNERLRENGIEARVDHRSLKDQGIDREPTSHMGPAVAAMERRGVKTEVGKRIEDEVAERLARARAEGIKERELVQANKSIIDLSGDLAAAKRDCAAAELVAQAKTQLVSGAADFRAKFMANRAAKIEADRQVDLARQAAERAQLEARRKTELERIAQERQRQALRPGPKKDGPDFSPGR
jgi:ATP-dependent exoDNAse (exonuclease V) alpha subunit